MKDPRDLIIEPIVSEKSYALLERNVYTFRVHPDATKPEIHDAVEAVARPPTGKVGREVAAFTIGDEARDLTVDVDVDLERPLRLRVDGPSGNA